MPSRSVFLIRQPSEAGSLSPIAPALSLRTISVTNESIKHQGRNHRNQHNWDYCCCCCSYLHCNDSLTSSKERRVRVQHSVHVRAEIHTAKFQLSNQINQRAPQPSWNPLKKEAWLLLPEITDLADHPASFPPVSLYICALAASKNTFKAAHIHGNSSIKLKKKPSGTFYSQITETSDCTQLHLVATITANKSLGGMHRFNPIHPTIPPQLSCRIEDVC